MGTHTWTHDTPRIRADGERIEQGDEFVPTDHESRCWPDRITPVDGTCKVEMDNGEVCGRSRPCQYHDPRTQADVEDGTDESEEIADGEE